MGNYVALIRGVGPTNPNMRNDKLGAALESVGCTEVQPVLASGNLVFRSAVRTPLQLEAKIEKVFREKLGLSCAVIVRGQKELEAMVARNPFKGAAHGKEWYLIVTFRKNGPPVFNQIVRAEMDGPEFMAELEKRHGKLITTRTWNTILKILAKMQASGDALSAKPRRR
jgi:uncharacterized protein (DUF1697 family)